MGFELGVFGGGLSVFAGEGDAEEEEGQECEGEY